MRNTDLVTFVGFSTGGTGSSGVKVRFATDHLRRTKVLTKIGATNIVFYPLPQAMTKADAVKYLSQHNDPQILEQAFQDAIARATERLIPNSGTTTSSKTTTKKSGKTTKSK